AREPRPGIGTRAVQPATAEIERAALQDFWRDRPGAATDAGRGFQDDEGKIGPLRLQASRGANTGRAGADDGHVEPVAERLRTSCHAGIMANAGACVLPSSGNAGP